MATPAGSNNFEPQLRDTRNGPHIHTYVPREDGSVMIGGVIYRAVAGSAAATGTVGVNTAAGVVPVTVTQAVPPPAPVILPAATLPMVYTYHFPYSYPSFGFPYSFYHRASHSLVSA